MIQLICTKCRMVLEMDDAFAGGACRCQHCGTIQTVPRHLKHRTAVPRQSRTLYQNRNTDIAAPSSGLDQLADVVASSSGLSSSHLRTTGTAKKSPAEQRKLKLLLFVSGGIIILLSGALLYLVASNRPGHAAPGIVAGSLQSSAAQNTAPKPHFLTRELQANTVLYVLDRGDSTREYFGYLKRATIGSIQSLGADRKFQVLFWNNGTDDAFPPDLPTSATPANVAEAEEALADIAAHGKTDATSALAKALARADSETEIVLVTGKAWDLDDSFVEAVTRVRGDRPIRIHTVSLGDPGASTALSTVAAKSRGTFTALTMSELKAHAN